MADDATTERATGIEGPTWGSSEWRDLYASDPLAWADNQIRILNKALGENPDNQSAVEDRDVLSRWRGAWLGEYNSQGRNKVDPQTEEAFQQRYQKAFEEAYGDKSEEEKAKAKAAFEGWKTRRSQLGAS